MMGAARTAGSSRLAHPVDWRADDHSMPTPCSELRGPGSRVSSRSVEWLRPRTVESEPAFVGVRSSVEILGARADWSNSL